VLSNDVTGPNAYNYMHTHTHTHTHIYIKLDFIYMILEVY